MSDEARIAREEAFWNAPKLVGFGLAFLGICLLFIIFMSNMAQLFGWQL